MKRTEQTLLEQMRISAIDVEQRKALFSFTAADADALVHAREKIEPRLEDVVADFYRWQTGIAEIALLIGDADTLTRLKLAQRSYVLDLFSGVYDLEYVNTRLRIGMVHKRIGVGPKLYLSAVQKLRVLLLNSIEDAISNVPDRTATTAAIEKLLQFDVSLVFDTYVRSMVSEIETAKERSDQYAQSMEERIHQLETLARTDALTGLLNVRHLEETITTILRGAQRRSEPVTLLFMDINGFKAINDRDGHQRGDEVLRAVSQAIKDTARMEDHCFRYGGDEFCVVMTNCREEQAEDTFVRRLRLKVTEIISSVSLSVGHAQTGPIQFISARDLIRLADHRMYEAKGKDRRIRLVE